MQVTLAGSTYAYKPSDDDLSRTSIELAAFDGEVGNGVLIIRDPASSYNVATGRQALVEEGSTVLSDGFMLDQDRTRGFTPAVAREYSFGLADANALLDGFRISRRRPAETDYERVMFFAGEDGPTWDTTWVLDSSTTTMAAKRYYGDGGWTSELIPDVISYTGKTLFLHDKADGSGRCLHYHVLTAGHTCGLSISDVISDSLGSATTFFPQEPQRTRTSIDLRNDIKGVDQAGRVSFASDATSIANHDADGLQHQAQLDVESAGQSDLDVQTAAFLASQKDDLDTYTCTIGPLDETALGLIRVGDLITVTSTVMGLSASAKRISHMTLVPVIGEGSKSYVGLWMAALEMGAPVRRRARVSTGRTPLPDMEPFVCEPFDVGSLSCLANDSNTYSYTEGGTRSGIGPGIQFDDLYHYTTTDFTAYFRAGGPSVSAYPTPGEATDMGNGGAAECIFTDGTFDYFPGGSAQFVRIRVIGPGTLTIHTIAHPGGLSGSCPTATTLNVQANESGGAGGIASTSGPIGTALDIIVPDTGACAYYVDMWGDASWGYGGSNWTPNMDGLPPCVNGDPTPGQEVHDAPFDGDGVTDSGTTAFGHETGSIVLLVNGIDWSDLVTDVDATHYTVAYPFPYGATVEVHYRSD